MRFVFWIVSMFITVSVFATNDVDTIPAIQTKTPFFKNADTLNKKRFAFVNGVSLLALYGSYHYIHNAWWADSRKSFHFDGGGSNITQAFDFGVTPTTLGNLTAQVNIPTNNQILGFFVKNIVGGEAIYALLLGGASMIVAGLFTLIVDDVD